MRDTDFLSGIAFVSTHHRRFEVLKGAVSPSTKLPRIGGSRREITQLTVEEYQQYSPQKVKIKWLPSKRWEFSR